MKSNDLYELFADNLNKDEEYKYLVEYCSNKLKDYKKDKTILPIEKKEIENFYESLNEFYKRYVDEISYHKVQIAYNYFKFLYNFFEYSKLENKLKSESSLPDYRIFAVRTIEVALILQQYNIKTRDLFFSQENDGEFYKNLLKIYNFDFASDNKKCRTQNYDSKILNEEAKLSEDGLYFQTEEGYTEAIKSMASNRGGYGTENPTLQDYLKLSYDSVYKVYHHIPKEKIGSGGAGVAIKLYPLDPYPKELYNEGKIIRFTKELNDNLKEKKHFNNDEFYEATAKSNRRIMSPSNKLSLYGIKDMVNEYNSFIDDDSALHKIKSSKAKSQFKKIQVNKSIGHLSAKSNLYLPSRYNIPYLPMMRDFLSTTANDGSYQYQILISSILLGIEIRQIFAIKLKLSNDFSLVNKEYIRVKLTTAYGMTRSETLFQNTKKDVEFRLPDFLIKIFNRIELKLFENLRKFILEEKKLYGDEVKQKFYALKQASELSDFLMYQYEQDEAEQILDSFLDQEIKQFTRYLQRKRKSFQKTIQIKPRYLHLYSFYYYKTIHKKSDIGHLFLKNKTANIHTVIAYVVASRKMINMTLWVEELAQKLNIVDFTKSEIVIDNEYSGSNKLIEPKEYKTFLSIIGSIKLKNSYANATLQMIYLRYSLAILLGTREYYFSTDSQEYSKRRNILLIHEKAKDIYVSKRIIPITSIGAKYIEKFFALKEQYNLQSFSPVIINDDGSESILNQNSIFEWIKNHENEILEQINFNQYEKINHFIKKVELDFGRHIFASEAHRINMTQQEYVDAFLNHFQRGTQDQGMYSSFDNKEYFLQIRTLMRKIEKKYLPYWKEINL